VTVTVAVTVSLRPPSRRMLPLPSIAKDLRLMAFHPHDGQCFVLDTKRSAHCAALTISTRARRRHHNATYRQGDITGR
jgi:hypothetical protein